MSKRNKGGFYAVIFQDFDKESANEFTIASPPLDDTDAVRKWILEHGEPDTTYQVAQFKGVFIQREVTQKSKLVEGRSE